MSHIVTPYQIKICLDIVDNANKDTTDYTAQALGLMTSKAAYADFIIEELRTYLDEKEYEKCRRKALRRYLSLMRSYRKNKKNMSAPK